MVRRKSSCALSCDTSWEAFHLFFFPSFFFRFSPTSHKADIHLKNKITNQVWECPENWNPNLAFSDRWKHDKSELASFGFVGQNYNSEHPRGSLSPRAKGLNSTLDPANQESWRCSLLFKLVWLPRTHADRMSTDARVLGASSSDSESGQKARRHSQEGGVKRMKRSSRPTQAEAISFGRQFQNSKVPRWSLRNCHSKL
jgi:hypothetical protein